MWLPLSKKWTHTIPKEYHVEKAYDGDLYFTVKASYEGWVRVLRYLWGWGSEALLGMSLRVLTALNGSVKLVLLNLDHPY